MHLISEDGVMAQADARAFAMLMAPNRTARRLASADRTIAGAINRVATMRRRREAGAERAYAIADRALQRELAESIAPGWGRTFRVKMQSPPFRSASDRKISRSKMAPSAARPLRRYQTPLIDARGRVALYMNVTYKGFNSKGWRSGLAAAHVEYIFRDGSLEEGDVQLAQRQERVGPQRMAAFDRGETVAVIESNARIVTLNELGVATDSTAKKLVLAERETALLARSVEIAARRRNLAAQRDTLAELTRRIRAVTIPSRRRPLPDVAIVRDIASGAASVRTVIEARAAHNVPMSRSANVRSIAATVRRMIAQRILLEARRTGVDQAVTQLGARQP